MATATIRNAWTENGYAHLAAEVDEGAAGRVEYIGRVPLGVDLQDFGQPGKTWTDLSAAEKKTALVTAVKAQRDAQQSPRPVLPGLSGTVTV